MQPIELSRLANWLNAELHWGQGATPADALVGPEVVIDSRLVTQGALFVALPGEQVDGHDYVAKAHQSGAAASVVTRPVSGASGPQLVVADPIAALSELARRVVTRAQGSTGLTTLAVTGSSGKTSTKDLLAQILEQAGPTVAPVGSFNNEIGVPLTACRIDDQTRFLVSEMGARGVGHISWLCSLTPPHISAALNVGHAHLGEFGSVEAIAQAKGEIVESLPDDGWAVLNADDPRVAGMAGRTRARLAWFSLSPPTVDHHDAELFVHAADHGADDLQRHHFDLVVTRAGGLSSHRVELRLVGAHHVPNALAAAAMAVCAGLDPAQVAAALSQAGPRSRWRMELTERADGAAVINDAYNANPDSMAMALRSIGQIVAARKAIHPGARGVAVLGDMLELGEDAPALHHDLGRLAAEVGFDLVVAIGDFADQLALGASQAGAEARVASVDEASSLDLLHGDVVLVKASRGLALERVAEALAAAGGDVATGSAAGTTVGKSGEQT